MSHAALPGICIAFIIVGSKEMIFLVLGAGITAYFGTFLIQTFVKHSRIKTDTAIGLVLSVFFGIGIVLLTIINRSAGGNQAGLNEFIFGQAAAWYAVMCIYLQALPSYYLPLLFFCLKN